ncbi:MAG: hypothetical protein JW751_06275 [Polyangiaceae bacterium]|nr:hypothetical protein [Polyangiaceae bacterium]
MVTIPPGLPPSLITAAAAGAASGKNPWLPFGVLFLLAMFARVPEFMMEPGLHRGLHGMMPAEVFLGLAVAFLTLAVLDSFADKLSWIECWLTPLSAAWRPFAAVGVSFLIAHAVAVGEDPALAPALPLPEVAALARGETAPALLGGFGSAALGASAETPAALAPIAHAATSWLLYVFTLVVGTAFGLLATVGKIGTRFVLAFIPIPHLKLAHSCLDDVFAFCVTVLGLFLDSGPLSWFAMAAGAVYLVIGAFAGPTLARLTVIQFRTAYHLVSKARRRLAGEARGLPDPPPWVRRLLVARGEDPAAAVVYPVYAYRTPGIGFCRVGFLVWLPSGLCFVTRGLFRPRTLAIPTSRIARVGFADTVTVRQLVVVDESEPGRAREHVFSLFPALGSEVELALARGAETAGWEQVRPRSPTARRGLPGSADMALGGRYVAATNAGSLNLQGLVTVFTAAGIGILTVGAFVPIGAGYLLSPFKPRFLIALVVSIYLSLLALTGAGWPVAVFYGVVLNVVVLRDLARQAVKAHVDGYVDRETFLPPVCGTVFVPRARVMNDEDRGAGESIDPYVNGSWRKVVRALRRERTEQAGA